MYELVPVGVESARDGRAANAEPAPVLGGRVVQRLALAPRVPLTLSRGWYAVESDLLVQGRSWPTPSLHLSAEGEHEHLIDLIPGNVDLGRRSVVLALPTPSDRLYLDPGGYGEGLSLSWVRLTPLHRLEAMAEMFWSLLPSSRRGLPLRRMRVLREAAAAIATGSWRLVLVHLADAYRAALAIDLGAASVAARVRLGTALRPGFAREAVWIPSDRVAIRPADTPNQWDCSHPKPKFDLVLPAGGWPLPAGWYRARASFGARRNAIHRACLYGDPGPESGQGASLCLMGPGKDGSSDTLLRVDSPFYGLQLHLDLCYGRFAIDRFELTRLSLPSALFYLLKHRSQDDQPRGMRSVLWGFVVDVHRHGIARATQRLKNGYDAKTSAGERSHARWVLLYDSFSAAGLEALSARAKRIEDGALISVIVPVYETPEIWLRRCIESVIHQAYPRWELCLADDASSAPHVRPLLDAYVQRDARIKVVHRVARGHIVAASNSALALAGGDFVAFLDHDDELPAHALLELAEAIRSHPSAALLYSDEDKIDEVGQRFEPYFKPDWNPDLERSQHYICHLTAVRADLVRAVGGLRSGFEGSQDHDLVLRCTERLQPHQIVHIPKILYHWRAIAGSTALHADAKGYAQLAGAKAVSEHLARIGATAAVSLLPHGHYRVRWSLPRSVPRVSLIIPTRDNRALLEACVSSILSRTTYPSYEILIIDNQSRCAETLAYLDTLAHHERIRVLKFDKPFNYSAINNWAVSQSHSEIIGLVNDDIEVITADWLEEMATQACRPEIGAVGAMLYYPDGRIQHAGVILGLLGVANHAFAGMPKGYVGHGGRTHVVQNLSAVTGACLVVRRAVFEQVGGLDERLAVAYNDIDFCLRVREAGYLNLWTPFAELYHHESASRGTDNSSEKLMRFRGEVAIMEARWGPMLQRDPAYNPNLTLTDLDFLPSFPPRV
ncbi:MAG: glycosyltransferase family 2 protein [Thiocapsa sp.]|uniref:glycosyltransferase family 2 protein n=1 Tax=Thiocapsa sp. TaxID=2024551 RepID=UPI001BCDFE37|nr:glycosyltransferase family 2 protein [Thiocapsa sp.]QVL47856.1 MAG: glycosyltransferase family 2 protein [Thiocapsa sp.]